MREIPSPAPNGSFSPRVTSRSDGGVILSWLEPQGGTTAALRFSLWRTGTWSEPTTVAAAQPFSRHPSESPAVIALSDRNLIAYWSQKPAHGEKGTEEVDVYFALSTDGGKRWASPILVNQPGTGEENSYPSAAAVNNTHAALIWLDGNNWTKQNRVALMSRTVRSDYWPSCQTRSHRSNRSRIADSFDIDELLPSRDSFAVGVLSVAREAVQPPPKSVIKSMEQALRFIFTSKTAAVITGNRRVTKAA